MATLPNLQSLLDNIIDSSESGIFVTDREYRYLVWSKSMERISGISKDKVLGKYAFDVFPFLIGTGLEEIFSKCFAGEVITLLNLPYEVPETNKKGFNDVTYSPVKDDNGAIIAVMGVTHDTTEKYLAEKSILRSELKYKSLTQNAHDAFISFDENGAVTSWNLGAEDIFGYSEAEILGKDVGLLFPADFWRKYARDMEMGMARKTLAKHGWSCELFGTRSRGSQFPIDISISAWKFEKKTYFSAVIRDISASKHIEAVAEDQQIVYEALLKAQSDLGEGVLILGAKSEKILYANSAICEMYGYSRDEIMQVKPKDLLAPELKELTLRRLESRLKENRKNDKYETVHIRKDGTRINVDLSISLCETGFGPSAVVLIRNITKRKQSEQALREEELRLRALSEASFEGIAFSRDRVVIEVNDNFCKIYGYDKSEVIGMKADDFVTPDDRAMMREHHAIGYEKPYTVRGLRKDGSVVHVEIRGKNIQYRGDFVRVTVFREMAD